jgi:hypothetical protein
MHRSSILLLVLTFLRCDSPPTAQIYNSGFVNLYYGTFFEGNVGDKPISKYKLICAGPEERVVGIHLIGASVHACLFVLVLAPLSLMCGRAGGALCEQCPQIELQASGCCGRAVGVVLPVC